MISFVIRARLRMILLTVGTTLFAGLLLWRPEAIAGGISRGLSIFSSILIPSLFPFLVLGGFLTRSGIAAALGRRLDGFTRRLFGLPGCCAPAILIGFLGGYPAGGNMVNELVRSDQITREDARRMMQFCVCGGPGFIVSTVGVSLINSRAFGLVLLTAHLLSALLIGVLGTTSNTRRHTAIPLSQPPHISIPSAFTESITAACQSLLSMCGFLLVFSAVLALWDTTNASENNILTALLSCFLEVSCGCITAAPLGAIAPILLGFAVGFGGLSVHCQLAATLAGTGVLTPSFFLSRLLHGTLTATITILFLRILPFSTPVFGSNSPVIAPTFGGVGTSVFLFFLCGIWLLCVDKKSQLPYN